MKRFSLGDLKSDELQAFSTAIWDALVPTSGESGECLSVQGELVRANVRLQDDYFRNGSNYYWELGSDEGVATPYDVEELRESCYGGLLLFMLETLIANHNAPLDAEDVAYFEGVRGLMESDWIRHHRMSVLDGKFDERSLSEAEARELDELNELEQAGGGIQWEDLFDRAELCIANWCVANPELVDRQGRPVTEGGVRCVDEIFAPRSPAPPRSEG